MKRWFGLALLVFVGTAGWRIGDALSPDALSMAVGVLFGVMAGVPAALLVMAGSRRRSEEDRADQARRNQHGPMHSNGPVYGQLPGQVNGWHPAYAQQPPVIVFAGPQGLGNPQARQPQMEWFPQEPPARNFSIVGDREELVEDW